MKKLGSIISTIIEILVIVGIVLLTIFAIYFFLYRGYNIEQIKEISGISINFISDEITEIKQTNLQNELINIEPVESYKPSSTFEDTNGIEPSKKYYYNQLNDTGKGIYNVLESNIENLKTGTYEITLPDSVTNILYQSGGEQILSSSFQEAFDAYIYDHTDIFYIDTSKISLLTTTTTFGTKKSFKVTIGKGDNANYYETGFTSKAQIQNSLNTLENIRREIINNVQGLSDYEKIKYVHDWLVDNIEYDVNFENQNSHNIYGTFIDKQVVCEGYAKAFKYIIDELDIPCILVKGVGKNSVGESEKHIWNYVYLEENWYAVDVTWDDPIIEGGGRLTKDLKYKNFLKGRIEFNTNHNAEGRISIGGKEFVYPILSSTDYE